MTDTKIATPTITGEKPLLRVNPVELSDEVSFLRAEVARLTDENLALKGVSDTSTQVSWKTFFDAAMARFGGKSRGYQQWFINSSSYQWADLTKWRRSDAVPIDAYNLLLGLEAPVPTEKLTAAGRKEIKAEARTLLLAAQEDKTLTGAKISTMLSEKFNRTVTEGMVKRYKEDMRKANLIP